ncbi:hypothetical protein ABBQ32_000581 [Trebouxia sp. C0010 RCD-2024]
MSASDSEATSASEGADGNSDDSLQDSGSEEMEEEDNEEEEEEVLEPKVLPQRGTRGNRMNTLIAEEDSADEDFWQQEFFAEEGKDEEYEKSSEGEDEADTDFSESVEAHGTGCDHPWSSQGSERILRACRSQKVTMRSETRRKQPVSEEAKALQAEQKAERLAQLAVPGEAPTLRHSTRIRVEEAQQVRQRAEKVKPKRIRSAVEQRPLTQDELLAEAARTELDNLRDLEQMVALEEATRKKAMYKRSKYSGPMIRFHSKKVDDVGLTMVEVVNMLPPPYMLPQKAPKPPAQLRCAVTGRPAKYRDPSSGYGYADLDAYKELKQRLQSERRGLTGRRTKRQSSKLPRQDAESDPAQLATGAAQADAAAAPDAQASEPRDLITVQMQPATDGKAAEPFGVAVSSETAPPPAAAAPETVVMSDQRLAAAAPAGPAGTAQSQPSVTTVPMPVVSTAAAATEAVTSALLAQQGSQQSLVSANAAAAGPGSGASAPSGTADMLTASAAVTSVALPPATSKALASPAGTVTLSRAPDHAED